MINYEEIIENLRDEDVFHLLEELGAEPIDKDGYFLCKTICHHAREEESKHKLYYYKNTHLFYCFSECGPLSIFKLLKDYYSVNDIIYDWYNDILQVILNCSLSSLETSYQYTYKSQRNNYIQQKNRQELPSYPNGILDCFIQKYPIEWVNDSITPSAMDKFGIRYSPSWNKIIIPHYDINGRLIGIRGRALNPEEAELYGKYMPVQIEGKWYSHPLSLNLYGLEHSKNNIKKYGICYIFESEKSVLQFESFQMPHCAVASCGSNLNKFQIDLLVCNCQPREIVVCYDREEEPGENKYFLKLYNMCKKYLNYCNMSFIYDRNGISKMKDSPSDNGEAVFQRLLSERVKVR